MPRGSTPEARRARNIISEKWDKDNTRQIKFKLNLRTDADILAHLDALPNVQGYVKRLIRDDIAAHAASENHFEKENEHGNETL